MMHWVYLVDLAVYKELDPPVFVRGYLIGFDPEEIQSVIEQWGEVKCKCIGEEFDIHMHVRRREFGTSSTPINTTGVEDIRAFLADCSPQAAPMDLSGSCFVSLQ